MLLIELFIEEPINAGNVTSYIWYCKSFLQVVYDMWFEWVKAIGWKETGWNGLTEMEVGGLIDNK